MAEYFEKDGLLLRLEDRQAALVNGWGPHDHYTRGFEEAVDMVRDHPAADAAPVVHGRWEFLGPNRLVKECMCGTCSVCKVRSKYIVNPTLCPNCGAKMDKTGAGR